MRRRNRRAPAQMRREWSGGALKRWSGSIRRLSSFPPTLQRANASFPLPTRDKAPVARRLSYFANSTARLSRITVTLICPG